MPERVRRSILETVERARPQRLVIDSLAEIRLLAGTTLRFRRQVLALKQFFTGKGITVTQGEVMPEGKIVPVRRTEEVEV